MRDDYGQLIGEGRVNVAEADGAIAGLLVLLPQDDALLLDNVAVDPARHGTGIGRALLLFAEESARAAGYGAIRLYTQEIMVENVALYSRIGYRETHRAEEKGLKRIYMLKTLAADRRRAGGPVGGSGMCGMKGPPAGRRTPHRTGMREGMIHEPRLFGTVCASLWPWVSRCRPGWHRPPRRWRGPISPRHRRGLPPLPQCAGVREAIARTPKLEIRFPAGASAGR